MSLLFFIIPNAQTTHGFLQGTPQPHSELLGASVYAAYIIKASCGALSLYLDGVAAVNGQPSAQIPNMLWWRMSPVDGILLLLSSTVDYCCTRI